MLDLSCCVALVLIIARDVFDIVRMSGTSRFWSRGTTDVVNNDGTTAKFSFQDLGDLNPDYIRDRFAFDNEQRGIVDLSIMLNAIATMAFFVPILQVAWILSDGGKRRVASQALVLIMALAGGMCELIVSLMSLGIRSTVIGWFGNSDFFNLENWIEEDSGDMIGWRVLELVYTIMRGLTLWINAFEWISIFCIMVILFFTIRSENKYHSYGRTINSQTFGMKWASLGLVIGLLGLLEFVADLLRLRSWWTYFKISLVVRSMNMLVLVPVYLIVLGRQLPKIKQSFEVWDPVPRMEDNTN